MVKTVLLVDYEPRSIDRIRAELSRLGLRIVLATDGAAAEREFSRERPDLALVRDLLPGKLGYQLCREMKASAHGERCTVLLMTRTAPWGRGKLLASRCDDWIETPVDERSLRAKVSKFFPGLNPSCV